MDIKQLMHTLDISEAEAKQLIADDKAIDRGAKMFDLDPEREKASRDARRADRKPNSTPSKREKKKNPEKEDLCQVMRSGLERLGIQDFDISNSEREFAFEYEGKKYKVVLSCPRNQPRRLPRLFPCGRAGPRIESPVQRREC